MREPAAPQGLEPGGAAAPDSEGVRGGTPADAPAFGGASLEETVRKGAEDRWLASRLAPQPERAWLVAVAALDLEFARIPALVSQPAAAALRMRWWLDQLETMLAGKPPQGHPLAHALAPPVQAGRLPVALFGAIADARLREFEESPFEGWPDLESYLDGVSVASLRLGAHVCWPSGPLPRGCEQAFTAAGRAYGLTQLLRQLPAWTARRRTMFPRRLMERVGLSLEEAFSPRPGHAFASAKAAMRERAMSWHKEARAGLAGLPSGVFPAIAHTALTPLYHRAMQRQGDSRAEGRVPLLSRQVRIVAAAALGRI